MTAPPQHPDVFIVGGGPGGLAAAIAACAKGFRVTVADRAQPPIDKTCGEGLMPETVKALESLGIPMTGDDGMRFCGIRFRQGNSEQVVEAKFHCGPGVGLRRTILHAKLVQRAREVGVTLLWGARVTPSGNGEFACNGRPIRSRWLIGADGERSQVRKWVTPRPPRREQMRFGYRQHFQVTPWTDFVEVYWGRTCQVVVTPVGPREVGVAVTSRRSQTRIADALLEFPQLARRLEAVSALSRERGAPCALLHLRAVYKGHVALLGDASGSVDPLTGEGLGLAFRQAPALAVALSTGNLSAYQEAHDQIGKVFRLTSRFMLYMDVNEWFRNRVFSALAAEPSLFSRLLNSPVEALSLSSYGLGNALRTGWRLLSSPGVDG